MKMSTSNVNHHENIREKTFTYDLDPSGFVQLSGFDHETVIERTLKPSLE